eukprot:CAMPEP_0198543278 /NCGR_PEP_ID=MMETSP1462-20131121/59584_1 /TAXON_ID=1333877 /ORGANISM="Brandtodinium nutriculum, Strain RCC3387" /LENGTH=37 /DNA_ID= /DNA_START= /DNA_END= /DNA_ORIENTATION=
MTAVFKAPSALRTWGKRCFTAQAQVTRVHERKPPPIS